MSKITFIILFLFSQIFSWSQDTIKHPSFSQGIKKISDKYYFADNIGTNKRIGTIEIFRISGSLAKEKKLDDLKLKINKVKGSIGQTVFCTVFGASVIMIGGGVCVASLMQYSNAYTTDAEVDKSQKIGITVGLSSLAVGLTFETFAIVNKRKKKKRITELVDLYNKYSN